jgi:hypothetical protein
MSKLDRLVAERVMNWRTHTRNTAWWVDADVENGLVPSGGVRGLTSGMDRWSPSTSIKTAWEVQVACADAGLSFGLTNHHGTAWTCAMLDCGELFEATHESPTVAICLCALKAFGVDEATIQEAMR